MSQRPRRIEPVRTGQRAAPGARGPPRRILALPEAPERRADPQPRLRLATLLRPAQRSPDVVELGIEPLEPAQLLGSEKGRLGRFGKLAVEVGVATADFLAVAALGQPLERVLADRLEHSEAGLAAAMRLRPEQVVVQERLDPVDDVELEADRRQPRRRRA